MSSLEGEGAFAIFMNASSLETATDVDYLMTNIEESKAISQSMVNTYSHRLGSPETKRNKAQIGLILVKVPLTPWGRVYANNYEY